MDHNKITIIINTFKSEDKINECLKTIESKYKVIIVENSNNKNFKNELEKNYQNVECILAGKNLGYAKGNNLGLSKVKSEFALILNPDTTLGNKTIENFFISAKKLKDFSIIGPAKQDEFSNKDLENGNEQLFEVDYLKGFAMFFKLDEFNEIGFFDENFFIYLEEIDLCKRLKKKKKKIYLDRKLIINHLGGRSHNTSIDLEMELSRNWHWMWSTFYFNKKHFGYLFALFKVSRKFFSSLIKLIFYTIFFNQTKKKIYYHRFSGLFNSIIGKKSWYRPKIISD